jgi:hypothetical protein
LDQYRYCGHKRLVAHVDDDGQAQAEVLTVICGFAFRFVLAGI